MTIYGEWNNQFRPGPKISIVALYCGSFLLLALALTAVFTSAVQVTATHSRTIDGAFPIYAPYAQKLFIFRSGAHAGPLRDLIAPGASLLAAALILLIVPTSTTLAARLGTHLISSAFVLQALARPLEVSPRLWLEGEMTVLGLWRPATLAASALLIYLSERRRNELLSNVLPLTTPWQRLRLCAATYLAPLLLIAILAMIAGYAALAFAVLVMIVVMVVSNLSTRPGEVFEQTSSVEMREAAATAPVAMLIVVGAATWLFGFPPLALPNRAVLLGGAASMKLSRISSVNILTAADEAEQKKVKEEAERKSTIDIRWSKKKK